MSEYQLNKKWGERSGGASPACIYNRSTACVTTLIRSLGIYKQPCT